MYIGDIYIYIKCISGDIHTYYTLMYNRRYTRGSACLISDGVAIPTRPEPRPWFRLLATCHERARATIAFHHHLSDGFRNHLVECLLYHLKKVCVILWHWLALWDGRDTLLHVLGSIV